MRALRCLPILFALLSATAATAQVRIVGRVIEDPSELAIPGVRVTLRTRTGEFIQRTDANENGEFEFTVKRVAAVVIQATRIGYAETNTPVLYFDDHAFFRVEVRLKPDAVLLAPLEVVGRADVDKSPLLDNFRFRLTHGHGIYITRAEIEKRHPTYVTDMFRSIPGVQVSSAGSGSRPVVRLASSIGNCSTQIYVDGFLVNGRMIGTANPFRIDDMVSPGSVEGIEIYRGLSTIPPEFLNEDAACGVIAIWTRRGGN